MYTTLPGDTQAESDYTNILATLTKNYSLVILDCDFETDYNYFAQVQEIYLVQSLDILTIQPLTAFLRNLKAKNMLNPEKIRIVLNKMENLTFEELLNKLNEYKETLNSLGRYL